MSVISEVLDEDGFIADDENGSETSERSSIYTYNGEKIDVFPGHLTDDMLLGRPALKAYVEDAMSRSWDQRKGTDLVDLSGLVPFLATLGLGGKPAFDISKLVSPAQFILK